MGTFEEIGDDVVAAILVLLDLKSVIRATSSCKRWRQIVYANITFISEYKALQPSVPCLCKYVDAGNGSFRALGCAFTTGSTKLVDMGDVLPQLVASPNIISDRYAYSPGGHVLHRKTLTQGATHFIDLWKPRSAAVHVETYMMSTRGWKLEADSAFPVEMSKWDMHLGCDWTPGPGYDPILYKIHDNKLLISDGKNKQVMELTVQLSPGSAFVVTRGLVFYCIGTSPEDREVYQMVKVDMKRFERTVMQVDIPGGLDDAYLFMFDLVASGDIMLVKLRDMSLEAFVWDNSSLKWCFKLSFALHGQGYPRDVVAASEKQLIVQADNHVYVMDGDSEEYIEHYPMRRYFVVDLLSLFEARILSCIKNHHVLFKH